MLLSKADCGELYNFVDNLADDALFFLPKQHPAQVSITIPDESFLPKIRRTMATYPNDDPQRFIYQLQFGYTECYLHLNGGKVNKNEAFMNKYGILDGILRLMAENRDPRASSVRSLECIPLETKPVLQL